MSNTPRPSLQECRQERIAARMRLPPSTRFLVVADDPVDGGRCISLPKCGFWAVRLASGAPEVAARIFWARTTFEPGAPQNLMERSAHLSAELNGRSVAIADVWERRGREISEEFYFWLVKDREWARRFRPASPEANPTRKVDVRSLAPILPPRAR